MAMCLVKHRNNFIFLYIFIFVSLLLGVWKLRVLLSDNFQGKVFRVMTPCSDVGYKRFGGPCRPHLQGGLDFYNLTDLLLRSEDHL